MQQIGEVDILAARTYPLDPEAREAASEVIVEPGTYPVYGDGYTTLWMMTGELSDGFVKRRGDGLFTVTPADVPSGLAVTFPSRKYGPEELRDLLAMPLCTEGAPGQRLRFRIEAPAEA